MLQEMGIKSMVFRGLLGLLISVPFAQADGRRGDGGGRSSGRQQVAPASRSSPSMQTRSAPSGQRAFSDRSSANQRVESRGQQIRTPSEFSRTDNFSRGRAINVPAVSSGQSANRFDGRTVRTDNSFRRNADRVVERAQTAEPQQFTQTRRTGSVTDVGRTPRVSREEIAQPLSRSLRTTRSEQIAKSIAPEIKSIEPAALSRSEKRAAIVANRQLTANDNQAKAAANERRDRRAEVLKGTDRRSAASSIDRRADAGRGVIADNQISAGTIGDRRDARENWRHDGARRGDRQQSNWQHGKWSNDNSRHGDWHHGKNWGHKNCWYGNNHHGYFFVSIGSFWPWWGWYSGYPYYWYSYYYGYPYYGYPYYWYPYYGYSTSIDYPIGGNTYNYYNYYDSVGDGSMAGMQVPDYDALSAVGRNTAAQPETQSDRLFDEGVKAFGSQDYATAIEKFRMAVRLEPDDTVLPFTYAQALFANNQYEEAAAVVTTTLAEMAPYKADISYPRGLYKDENILTAQIENLRRAVLMDPQNAQLQLLYGYQLLGIGKMDEAVVPLATAKRDARTQAPAASLLDVLERAKQPTMTPVK